MVNDDARDALTNILDRAAFTPGPFWDAEHGERARISDLLGTPEAVTAGSTGSLFLALAVLNEVAIELATTSRPEVNRADAIARIRQRVGALLAD